MRRVLLRVTACLAALLAVSCAARLARPPEEAPRPRRVVVIVVDQLRADLVDRVEMPNVRRLRARGAWFDDAIVGHMSAKTVVSHAVLTHGVLPKRLGWADDQFRDARAVLGTAGAIWVSGRLGLEQMKKLLPDDLPTIASAFPGRRLAVGQKGYAANSMAGHDADVVVTMSRSRERPGILAPAGLAVPPYLDTDRFRVDATATHGTEEVPSSLGGNRYVPGDDPERAGGDLWVADVAVAFMEREEWGAVLVALGGVDKVGHMFGADADLERPNPTKIRFEDALKTADAAIGKILAHLDAKGLSDETLVVLTADHGALFAKNHRARWVKGVAGYDTQWGVFANAEPSLDPQPEIAPLVETGAVQATSTDTALRIWVKPGHPAIPALEERLRAAPGVVAVFAREGDRYVARHTAWDRLPPEERAFQERHAQRLLDTMASETSADLIGLLDGETSYGTLGEHGGTQRAVQRIPILFAGPGVKPGRFRGDARLVDVAPTVWRLAGKEPPRGLDGSPLCAAIAAGCGSGR